MSLTNDFTLAWRVFSAERLGDSVFKQLHHWQPTELQIALDAGHVQVNSTPISTAEYELNIGDEVQVFLPQHQELEFNPNWHVVWQRQDLMVVHKPAQLPVSRTTQNLFGTLISLVRRQTENFDAHLLHRLDAETSGLIVLTKYSKADQRWKKRIDQLIERKVYHALVTGEPEWDSYLAEHWLAEKNNSPIRTQMHIVTETEADTVKAPKLARTQFKVLQRMGAVSLIECDLLTGRKHQIRAQLAHLGVPIVGDKIYSHNGHYYLQRLERELNAEDIAALGAEHHLLHAYSLTLNTKHEVLTLVDNDYPSAWQPYLNNGKD